MAANKVTYLLKVFGLDPILGYFSVQDANEVKTVTDNHADLIDGLETNKAATNHTHTGVYQPVMGTNDNYVTDAEKISIGTIGDKIDKPTTSATLNPAAISLAKEAGTSYDAYQQTGILALVVTGSGSVVGGNADFDIIKTADAITVLVDSTDITTIGKWPTSNDFSTTVGDIDHVLIFKKEPNTNNATGVYYMITNLG